MPAKTPRRVRRHVENLYRWAELLGKVEELSDEIADADPAVLSESQQRLAAEYCAFLVECCLNGRPRPCSG